MVEPLEEVAIIGVLVAISIPIFTSQLEKSKEATDQANIRSAYAEVSAAILSDTKKATSEDGVVKYDDKTKTYSAEVTSVQGDSSSWVSDTNPIIGGQAVEPAAAWTISGNEAAGKVTIKKS